MIRQIFESTTVSGDPHHPRFVTVGAGLGTEFYGDPAQLYEPAVRPPSDETAKQLRGVVAAQAGSLAQLAEVNF